MTAQSVKSLLSKDKDQNLRLKSGVRGLEREGLAEDLGSIPCTYMMAHACLYVQFQGI